MQRRIISFLLIWILGQVAYGNCHWQTIKNYRATKFKIEQAGDMFRLTIEGEAPVYFYKDRKQDCGKGIYLKYPLHNMAVFSTTYIGFLQRLKAIDSIGYISTIKYVSSMILHKGYKKGVVKEIGYPPQAELLIKYGPSLILDFPPVGVPSSYISLVKKTIPILFIKEHLEGHPLARAEWIKVFGLLTGKFNQAKKEFSVLMNNYDQIVRQIKRGKDKQVLIGKLYNGVWNAPSPTSYLVQFFIDLKVPYVFAHKKSQRLLISWEEVLTTILKVGWWFPQYGWKHREEIFRENRMYKLLGKKLLSKIYVNSKRLVGSANDYWESGPAYPDRILQDLATIFYPHLFASNPLYFYIRL